MARDLWDIVEATTKPPKEEDEDLFQAWSKKNSLALHVIQNSCGPDTFSKIREKSLAKAAWDTLAKEYKTPKNTNSVVRDVLGKDNFEDWSARMKTYLMAQDLWKVVETEPPNKEEDEGAFKVWRKKNSIALKAIQNSCESNIFSEIKKIRLAKTSWDTLAKKYYNAPNGSDKKLKADLYKAVASGRWKSVKDILDNQRELVRAKITSMGETALHIAVAFGHDHTVKELVNLMSTKDLEIQDDDSFTALMSAGVRGRYEQVRCMLRKNKELLAIGTHKGYLPVDMAMYFGQEDMARFLFSETPQEVLMQSNQEGMNIGAKLCVQAVASRNFDIALSLIEKDESLAYADDGEGSSPLLELASKPHAFPSGNPFVFWKQWIYKYCIRVHVVSAPMARDKTLVDISNEDHRAEHDRADRPIGSVPASLMQKLFSQVLLKPTLGILDFVDTVLGVGQLYETKLIHGQSEKLLGCISKKIPDLSHKQREDCCLNEAIMSAVKNGIVEIVVEMLKADLELQWETNENYRNIFMLAILHRRSEIFNIIFRLHLKKALINLKDENQNCMLHMSGMFGDSTVLDRIPGAALQMQRELQWFKELESIVPRTLTEATNKDGSTPRQLFKKNHMELKKEGERWMKDTSTSCTVVGALIITIMFAAAITFPGGIDQNTGLPLLLNDELFKLFIISDAFSLFSATTSVLMFLGILTSRYAEDDFLKSLPKKMIIGLSTLFLSLVAMMTSFSAILLIMLRGHPFRGTTWIIIAAICLASIPVTLFVLIQFPLLVEMFVSTYLRSIFDRKSKHGFN